MNAARQKQNEKDLPARLLQQAETRSDLHWRWQTKQVKLELELELEMLLTKDALVALFAIATCLQKTP